MLLPLIQKIENRLAEKFSILPGKDTTGQDGSYLNAHLFYLTRKGNYWSRPVLISMSTYFMTAFKLPKWARSGIDKFRRSFLWRGKNPDNLSRVCLVNLATCTRPRKVQPGSQIKVVVAWMG
jgi:hypothetical protein